MENLKEYKLVFNETFKNLDNWNFEKGFIRNKELQYYTDRNYELKNGLTIYGKKEIVKNENYDSNSPDWQKNREFGEYTSCSINTFGKFDFLYGVVEIKAKYPFCKGSWPAAWMMGNSSGQSYVLDWPYCDEIDIFEQFEWKNKPAILTNFMCSYDGTPIWSLKRTQLNWFLAQDIDWANKYHIYKLEWTPKFMKIYIDDQLMNSIQIDKLPGDKFKKKCGILLNLAIGHQGEYPQDQDMPMVYNVEYVKVYQKK